MYGRAIISPFPRLISSLVKSMSSRSLSALRRPLHRAAAAAAKIQRVGRVICRSYRVNHGISGRLERRATDAVEIDERRGIKRPAEGMTNDRDFYKCVGSGIAFQNIYKYNFERRMNACAGNNPFDDTLV